MPVQAPSGPTEGARPARGGNGKRALTQLSDVLHLAPISVDRAASPGVAEHHSRTGALLSMSIFKRFTKS
jgi:hypothetical protein